MGNSREDSGFSFHTVLAMNPQTEQILGCLTLEPFLRKLVPVGETKAQRKKRPREAQGWQRSVQQIARVAKQCQWIDVGDNGSDIFPFWQRWQELDSDFALRVAQDRDVQILEGDGEASVEESHLKTLARSLPAVDAHVMSIPAQHHRPKREAL